MTTNSISDIQTNILYCNENDNLGLGDVNVADISNDILFPEDLNRYLRGQIQFLTHSNGMLEKTLTEKDTILTEHTKTISQLKTKLSEYEKLNNVDAPYLMSGKLVELSKRLRDRNAEIEVLKTKCSKLQQKLTNVESVKDEPKVDETRNVQNNNQDGIVDETKMLQDKLAQTTNKLFEVKNINYQLKNELKTAHKILQQEVGDNFTSIQNIASNTSNWRGRAQQILSLQQKNSELQEKLSMTTLGKIDSIVTISNKNDSRKQLIEQLQKEQLNVKSELDDMRKKLSSARARIKVLESECFSLKSKLNAAMEKSNHDEEIIKLLTNQVSSLEDTQNDIRKEKQSAVQRLEDENKELKVELSKGKCLVDNFKNSIFEKDQKIRELLNDVQAKNMSVHNNSSTSLHNININNKPADNKIQVLEVEVDRLLELVTVLNSRIEDERQSHSEMQINFQKERKRAAKLEVKLSRLELENSMNKSNTYSKSVSKSTSTLNEECTSNLGLENLKNNLELAEENVSVLKARLDIAQKEKELDLQRFSTIITEMTDMLKKPNTPNTNYSGLLNCK